jgi:putative proteasome-type protease
MTYCVALRLNAGMVFLSDSRTNAGVDQIGTFRKMTVFERAGERLMVLLTSGNLGVTQSVRQLLLEPGESPSVWNAASMHDAAALVGDAVRKVYERDFAALKAQGIEFACTLIFGGQIRGERCRLFQVYSAGNFIEASLRSCFMQIGETKYGKPILDRALTPDCPLDEAAKLALLSFDATMRSNLSVGMPIDMLRYRTDSFSATNMAKLTEDDPYWKSLRTNYSNGLSSLVQSLPPPPVWG